jgi:pantetheine-phosphate adenylyltransferase
MVNAQLAIYAGSFDPPTYGHLDLVERAAVLFPRVIVALGRHPTRQPLFDVNERLELLRVVCKGFANVEVDAFDGLLVNFARARGARVLVRGLRAQTDFEYELQIAQANADMAPDVDTIFLPARTQHGFVSASLVREIARHHGDVSRYVPEPVRSALSSKFSSTGAG